MIKNPPTVKFNHDDLAVIDLAQNPEDYNDLEE